MKIEVNLKKKYLFMIIGTILLFGGLIFGYAYNNPPVGGTPSVFGHSIDEIDGFPTCLSGQALVHNSTGWGCLNLTSTAHFGSWVSKSPNVVYTAATDGFVAITTTNLGDWGCTIRIETPSGTTRQVSDPNDDSPQVELISPVRASDTWRVNTNCPSSNFVTYWISLEN